MEFTPAKLNLFTFFKLPSAFWSGVRVKSISPEEREMKQFSRQGKIERMLLERWSYIRKSKLEKKLSFRIIAKNLYEKFGFKVEQSYICKIWNKIEGDL